MSMYTRRDWREVKDIRELENIREATSYAIQSQYAASEKILALAAGFQERICPEMDVELFFRKTFDIYTAEGAGLDNWGVILGMGRTIEGPYQGPCFGFTGSGLQPFDRYPFIPDSGAPPAVAMITLDDDLYRLLLLYKALANISASDAATQNKLLSVLIDSGVGDDLFPLLGGTDVSGQSPSTRLRRSKRLTAQTASPKVAYVLEIDTMVIRWVFEDSMTTLQLAVFKAAGTLARGAGVGWELYAVNPEKVFGFEVTFGRSSVAQMSPEASSGDAPSSLHGSLSLASATPNGRSSVAQMSPEASSGDAPSSLHGSLSLASATPKEFQPFNQAPFAPDKALIINRS